MNEIFKKIINLILFPIRWIDLKIILELRKFKINNIKKAKKYKLMKYIFPLLKYIQNSDIRPYYGHINSVYEATFEFNNTIISIFRSIHGSYLFEVVINKTKICSVAEIVSYGDKHSNETITDLVTYENLKDFINLLLKRENNLLSRKYKIDIDILNSLL